MLKKKIFIRVCVLIVLSMCLAACGSGSDNEANKQTETQSAQGSELTITATNFQFNSKTYKVPANKEITIHFESKEGNHGIKIEGTDVDIKGKGSAKVTFKPGTYAISCNIFCGSGHAKMQSKIVAE